ncbi:hypothetical protein EBAPG3_010410 [Nitrosospira lacus]|uniref:Uncharacterized protein n=1 Tax=Nitrosospira lacus TaxID=1288494 RepID=A0A1W6SQQ5_9PROT|nr:hypothetical protein [Nitrosospira lacus]ARO88154.1 hypothetical protein EBAPG3_010410 [Nitrosospira lacus]
MADNEFNELAGRIEAISTLVLHAIADLEMSEFIDGQGFTKGMRQVAEDLQFPQPHLDATRRTLLELAGALDSARMNR